MNLITMIAHKNTFVGKEKDLNNSSSSKKASSMPCLIDHDILFEQKNEERRIQVINSLVCFLTDKDFQLKQICK